MKFSLFKHYGAKNSVPVFDAFAQALTRHGQAVSYHDDTADVAVIWSVLWKGRMAANRLVWQSFLASNRPVVVLEVGALQRGTTWRMGLNGIGLNSRFYPLNQTAQRAEAMGLFDKRLITTPGSHILVALQQTTSHLWHDMPPVSQWLPNVITQLKSVTERPIVIRPHPRESLGFDPVGTSVQIPRAVPGTYDDFDFEQALQNSWCVINWSSNTATQAALHGVPVMTGPDSLAAPVGSWDLAVINQVAAATVDLRFRWLSDLAYHEWTLTEIQQGIMLPQLLSRLQSI